MTVAITIAGGLQLIDCRGEQRDVAVHIEIVRRGRALHGVEPAGAVGIGVRQTGLGGQCRIDGLQRAIDDTKQVAHGLESLDGAEPLAVGDGLARLHLQHHLHQFAEHSRGELRDADVPEPRRVAA